MTLNQNDAELFYELWFPLLDYTIMSPRNKTKDSKKIVMEV